MSVDYVVFRTKGAVRLWGVDIKLGSSSSLAAFMLFDYLLAGNFHSSDGTYLVAADGATSATHGASAAASSPVSPRTRPSGHAHCDKQVEV